MKEHIETVRAALAKIGAEHERVKAEARQWKETHAALEVGVKDLASYIGCEPDEVGRTFDALRARVKQLTTVLKEVKLRIIFVGWPAEPMWEPHGAPVPDWRNELLLIEATLAAPEQKEPAR